MGVTENYETPYQGIYRVIENYEVFKTKLEGYLWVSILGEEQDDLELLLPSSVKRLFQ